MKRSAKVCGLVLAGLASSAAGAWSQTSPTVVAPNVMDATVEVKAASYVQETGINNLFAVKSSELALKKSRDPKVRRFAERTLKDNEAATTELKQAVAAAKVDAAPPNSLDGERQSMLDQLQSASGADFDRSYLQMQMQNAQDSLRTQVDYRMHGGNAKLQSYATSASTRAQTRLSELGKISQGQLQ